jgi:hypothetical protein
MSAFPLLWEYKRTSDPFLITDLGPIFVPFGTSKEKTRTQRRFTGLQLNLTQAPRRSASLVRHIAIECSRLDVTMTHQFLDRSHANTLRIKARPKGTAEPGRSALRTGGSRPDLDRSQSARGGRDADRNRAGRRTDAQGAEPRHQGIQHRRISGCTSKLMNEVRVDFMLTKDLFSHLFPEPIAMIA